MFKQERSVARQRGFTLAEVLVATAIFAVIFVATLLIYDRSNRVFSAGTQASEMQQNTRVGYEKLVADLRLAGFDYKRAGVPTNAVPQWLPNAPYGLGLVVVPATSNGFMFRCTTAGTSGASSPSWNTAAGDTTSDNTVVWTQFGATGVAFDQPDEQIEYAWTSAITIRGNYDYDGDDDVNVHYEHGREKNLESAAFPVVTTGNHEIVTYALVSDKTGASNSDAVTFYADVNSGGSPSRRAYPGGVAERLITIRGVDLSNANPPYHLNRYTLADDGALVTTPLADNIRSLTFSYFQDQAARQPLTDLAATPVAVTDVGGDDQYDPVSPNTLLTNRIIRGKIRAVTVTLVGMNATSDVNFQDPTDTIAPNFRKFALQSTIVPRNLGITGLRQSSANPPPAPTLASVCYGYCGVAVVSWTPGAGGIDAVYDVLYDTSATGPFTSVLPAGTQTTYAVDLTQRDMTKHYYFKVMAKNNAGSTISTNTLDVDVTNATKPRAPTGVTITSSTSGPSKISLTWAVDTSGNATGAPACNPVAATPLYANVGAELQGYRIYRSTASSFNITDTGVVRILDENGLNAAGTAVTPAPVSNGAGGWLLDDTSISNCVDYYYEIQAVEWCAANNNRNTGGDFNTGLTAFTAMQHGKTTTNSLPVAPTGLAIDPATTCSFGTNKCYPVTLTWSKVTKDVATNTIVVDKYYVYRLQKKNGVAYPSGTTASVAGTLTGQSAQPSPITFSEPLLSNLAQHDSDNIPFSYEYYVTADSCGEGAKSSTVTVPSTCSTGVTMVAAGATSGSGTAASPWVSPDSVQANPPSGKTISSAYVSLDGAAATVLASPFSYPWTDSSDGATHEIDFIVQVGTCTETIPVWVENQPATCSLSTGTTTLANRKVPLIIGPVLEVDLRLTNSDSVSLAIQSIDITYNGVPNGKKLTWASLEFPSTSRIATGGSAQSLTSKTFTLNPLPGGLSASDAVIPASGPTVSLLLKMIFTQTSGSPDPADKVYVTSVVVHYTSAHTGGTTLDCTIIP